MTLNGNVRKYWALRKTGKQESSRRQSTQKKTSIISMKYPSNYLETSTTGKQGKENNCQNYNIIRLSPQRSANKYGSIQVRNQSQPNRNDLEICRSLQTHKYHTYSHTPCLMMGKYLETSPKIVMIQDMISSKNRTKLYSITILRTVMHGEIIWGVNNA